MAYTKPETEFQTESLKLEKINPAAKANIAGIPADTWATYAFPVPRFGHITSNIVETVNAAWKKLDI